MAVRAARSGLRSDSPRGGSPENLLLPPVLLLVRHGDPELLRSGSSEFARLSRFESVVGTPTGWSLWLCTHDRRRHPVGTSPLSKIVRLHRPASADPSPQYHHFPLFSRGVEIGGERRTCRRLPEPPERRTLE